MSVTVTFDEKNLRIEADVWNNLENAKSAVGLSSVIAAADGAIQRGGAFVIHRQEGDILRAIHRPSEFAELVDGVNERRAENGLDPVNR
ncbi:hypothetical protein [Burkholderia multivorans]|uniref:hypothetical protein n=1 Tax=Burkholderia multivorans TaxID=87883 RepID=UPI00075B09AA|nr:hypothetical protein [Burkholderia multivorans]AOK67836.1 hypothetical protein WM33_20075 [Burkholderia multivorans]KVZ80354.1 hypothetical protein WL23_14150 [Burkholderia multivorans]